MSNAFFYQSPIGTLRIAEENGALVSAAFVDDAKDSAPGSAALFEAKAWLDRYFQGRDPGPVPNCTPKGTAFQKAVWSALLSVPYGKAVSYGGLAVSMGLSPRHARAIGSAVGKNPLVLFYPCHRVIGKGGNLTGFAYGIERKKALLEIETRRNA